ncbi:MAG: carboxypeptidase regulatory-like domain-containing protein [Lachnospiraceae bacterium]|jgi:hypothetical protein|nr:carboxypeptidase regulatory-like domain-containing protein [Lachnospiraceae bacterium]
MSNIELEDQKYAYLVKGKFKPYGDVEQVEDGDLTGLVPYEDYLITDFSEGNIPLPEDTIVKSDTSYCGNNYTTRGKYILKPEQNLYTNLRGIRFLVSSFLKGRETIADGVEAYYATASKLIDFFDLYVGTYTNRGMIAKGLQINDFNLEISLEGQIIPKLSCYAKQDEITLLKDETDLQFLDEPLAYYDLKDVEFRPHLAVGQGLNENWESLACAVKTSNLNYSNGVEEDPAYKVCDPIFSSGYKAGNDKEISSECSVDQEDSKWREYFYGGRGLVTFYKINQYDLRYTLQTPDGRKLQIVYVNCTMGVSTGDNKADAEETLTFSPSKGLLQLDETGVKKASTKFAMIFDDTGLTEGAGEGVISYTNNTSESEVLAIKRVRSNGDLMTAVLMTVKPGATYTVPVGLEYGDYKAYVEGEEIEEFTLDSETYTIDGGEPSPIGVNLPVHVVNQSGENIDGAVVTIDNTDITCTTGSAGGCTLNNVAIGEITYTAEKENYAIKTGYFTVTGDDNEILNIELEEE